MKRYGMSFLLTFLMIFLFHSQAYTYVTCKYNGNDIKWINPTVTYYVNDLFGPSGTNAAVIASMQTWTDVSPSELTFVYGGTTSSTAHGVKNSTNIVTFGSLPAGVLAENYYWYYVTGSMIDSDIRFNTYYTWSTNGTPSTMDVQNIGTHEFGHSLCLKDLYSASDSTKTMYGYGYEDETQKSTLHQDDIDGMNYLYCGDPVYVLGGTSYSSLQAAYDDAGDGDTIEVHSFSSSEDLLIDINKEVTIEAGYDCDFQSANGETQMNSMEVTNGTMIISNGTMVVEEVVL
jgi:hypothetical protein